MHPGVWGSISDIIGFKRHALILLRKSDIIRRLFIYSVESSELENTRNSSIDTSSVIIDNEPGIKFLDRIAVELALFLFIGGYRYALDSSNCSMPHDVIIATDTGAAALWLGGSLAANRAYVKGDEQKAIELLARLFQLKFHFKVNASSEISDIVAPKVTYIGRWIIGKRLKIDPILLGYQEIAYIAATKACQEKKSLYKLLTNEFKDLLEETILVKALVETVGPKLDKKYNDRPDAIEDIVIWDIGRLSSKGLITRCTLDILINPLSNIKCSQNKILEDIYLTRRAADKMRRIKVNAPSKYRKKLSKLYNSARWTIG